MKYMKDKTIFYHIGSIWKYREDKDDTIYLFLCQVDTERYKFISTEGNRYWDESFNVNDIDKFNQFVKHKKLIKTRIKMDLKVTKTMKVLYG